MSFAAKRSKPYRLRVGKVRRWLRVFFKGWSDD
jgi:hypothetical protein